MRSRFIIPHRFIAVVVVPLRTLTRSFIVFWYTYIDIRDLCHILRAAAGHTVPLLEDISGGSTTHQEKTYWHDHHRGEQGETWHPQAGDEKVSLSYLCCNNYF